VIKTRSHTRTRRLLIVLFTAILLPSFSHSRARPYFDSSDSSSDKQPLYWVAVFMVPNKDVDQGVFLSYTGRFYNKVLAAVHRCEYDGNIDIGHKCLSREEKPIRNCEYLSIEWDANNSTLNLLVDGTARDAHTSHSGKIFSHECHGIPFKNCLDYNLDRMAQSVRLHDVNCHQEGKKCKVDPDSDRFENQQ
jgi:hypothetical protein